MGNWMRKIWIGLLSGVAVLAASCFRLETPKVYGPPPIDDSVKEKTMDKKQRKAELNKRLQAIREILEEREGEEVYGSPEIIERFERENRQLRHEADSIEKELKSL